jgi:hypothetical protein
MSQTTHARRLLAIAIALFALAAASPMASYAGPVKPLCGSGGGPNCTG